MDLIYFLRVLLRRKWLILAICSIAMITAFLITRKAPKVYKAHARLITGISEQRNLIFSGTHARSPQKYEVEAKFQRMIEMIKSHQVLDLVSYQLILHDLQKNDPFRDMVNLRSDYPTEDLRVAEERYQARLDSMQSLLSTDELERKHIAILRQMNYDANSLRQSLDVRRIPGTDYIGIDFHSENPRLSAFVANQLCFEFIRYYSRTTAKEAVGEVEFYRKQVASKKNELNQHLKKWQQYQQSIGVSDPVSPNQSVLDLIDHLQNVRSQARQEIFAARRVLKDVNTRLKLPTESNPEGATRSGDSPSRQSIRQLNQSFVLAGAQNKSKLDSIELIRNKLLEQEFQHQLTVGQYNSPDSRELLRKKIQSELIISIAQERINEIDRALSDIGGQEAGSSNLGEASGSLGKEVDIARDAYLLALSKYSDAKLVASGSNAGTMNQAKFVHPPEFGEPSKPPLLIVLSGLVSFALCVVVLFILEYLDTSVKYPSRFTELSGLSTLGILNRLKSSNLDLVTLFSQTQKNNNLETYKQLLRKIRYELVECGGKSILVTSTKGGAGKTSLLVSLAYSLSLNGKRVLLIDTNFKNHALTDITAASPSLEKFMEGKISRDSLISSSVFERVDVIGVLGGNLSPAELLDADAFHKLMHSLKKDYDFILMEGPPLNLYSDTRELVSYCDKVMPIFSASANINQRDHQSIAYLQSLDDKLLGSVLNKVELRNLDQ